MLLLLWLIVLMILSILLSTIFKVPGAEFQVMPIKSNIWVGSHMSLTTKPALCKCPLTARALMRQLSLSWTIAQPSSKKTFVKTHKGQRKDRTGAQWKHEGKRKDRIAQNHATYPGTLSALRAPNLKWWSANRGQNKEKTVKTVQSLSLIHIWRCRRIERCRSRWSPYH